MKARDVWTFDTDMHFHRRYTLDRGVAAAAEIYWTRYSPTASASFSRLEIKGNRIQDLILLRNKVVDSRDLRHAMARVQRTGGRRTARMLAALVLLLNDTSVLTDDWPRVRQELSCSIDGLIVSSWYGFDADVDLVVDGLQCTRARETPIQDTDGWHATIPSCTTENTRCVVEEFFRAQLQALAALLAHLQSMSATTKTRELASIETVVTETLKEGRFPWEGRTCRSVGDLLIALEAKATRGLVSSNKKEHGELSKALRYNVNIFDSTKHRES